VILVTLGTHPQPMSRITPALERIARELPQLGPFHAQLGTTRSPSGWVPHAMMPSTELAEMIAAADVVITHGGPATIAQVRSAGRVPIVIPRRSAAGEHVDDHQVHYASRLAAAKEILLVEDEWSLPDVVIGYPSLVEALPAPAAHDPASAIGALGSIAARLLSGAR